MSNRPMCHAGIRVPDSAFVRQVCRKLRRAVALTSANLSGEPSPLAVSSGWIPAVSLYLLDPACDVTSCHAGTMHPPLSSLQVQGAMAQCFLTKHAKFVTATVHRWQTFSLCGASVLG